MTDPNVFLFEWAVDKPVSLSSQEPDVEKLEKKINCGQIEEVIFQVGSFLLILSAILASGLNEPSCGQWVTFRRCNHTAAASHSLHPGHSLQHRGSWAFDRYWFQWATHTFWNPCCWRIWSFLFYLNKYTTNLLSKFQVNIWMFTQLNVYLMWNAGKQSPYSWSLA